MQEQASAVKLFILYALIVNKCAVYTSIKTKYLVIIPTSQKTLGTLTKSKDVWSRNVWHGSGDPEILEKHRLFQRVVW